MTVTRCKDCIYWQGDPHDNGSGECTELVTAIEVNAGAYGADELDFFTPAEFYCAAGKSKDEGAKTNDNATLTLTVPSNLSAQLKGAKIQKSGAFLMTENCIG